MVLSNKVVFKCNKIVLSNKVVLSSCFFSKFLTLDHYKHTIKP